MGLLDNLAFKTSSSQTAGKKCLMRKILTFLHKTVVALLRGY
jgi:hypothetical protein